MAHGLSCSAACGIFPDIEPVSPALAGGFLSTVPPGKSPEKSLFRLMPNETSPCSEGKRLLEWGLVPFSCRFRDYSLIFVGI